MDSTILLYLLVNQSITIDHHSLPLLTVSTSLENVGPINQVLSEQKGIDGGYNDWTVLQLQRNRRWLYKDYFYVIIIIIRLMIVD